MNIMRFSGEKTMIDNSLAYAQQLDKDDPLAKMREQFAIPKQANGEDEGGPRDRR